MVSDIGERKALERQNQATAEIRLALLSGAELDQSLTLICHRAAELVDAPIAVICEKEAGVTRIVAGFGLVAAMIGTTLLPGASFAERVIDDARLIEIARRTDGSIVEVPDSLPDGPTMGGPVTTGGEAQASLTFIRDAGTAGFRESDRLFAEALAARAALAFEFDRAGSNREQTSDDPRLAEAVELWVSLQCALEPRPSDELRSCGTGSVEKERFGAHDEILFMLEGEFQGRRDFGR